MIKQRTITVSPLRFSEFFALPREMPGQSGYGRGIDA
jgi:hypothetical protein